MPYKQYFSTTFGLCNATKLKQPVRHRLIVAILARQGYRVGAAIVGGQQLNRVIRAVGQ